MRNRTKVILISVVSTLSLLVLFNMLGILNPVKSILDVIVFNPLRGATKNLSSNIANSFSALSSISGLNQKNVELEKENIDLKNKLSELKEIKNENDILRAQLGFESRLPLKTIPVKVVSYEPDNIRKFLTIDKGSRHGIQKGQPVISGGVLVGLVEQADSFSAKVFLVNDPEFRIRAIGQQERASGVVKGQIGQGLLMEKIAQSEKIELKEYVVTAGSDSVPKGILIGQVEGISKSDNAIFQSADLKSLINPNKLELIFVVAQ